MVARSTRFARKAEASSVWPSTNARSVPHVGGPIVTASGTVRIGGKRAARVGDVNTENGSSATIASGAATVNIGP